MANPGERTDVANSTSRPKGRRIGTCINCGEIRPIEGRERCGLCLGYLCRTGRERSAELIERATKRREGLRLCRRCRQFKPIADAFYRGQFDCKRCQLLNLNEWKARHPEYVPLFKRDAAAYARHRATRNAWRRTAKGQATAQRQHRRQKDRLRTDPEYARRRSEIMRRVKVNRRHRIRAAFIARVDLDYIYRRDRGRCGICRKRVNLSLRAPNPMCASIDHLIPIGDGGTHEPANVQLAHMVCNSRKWKKASPHGDQLMLIG
jgi:5-methylcytosine-specific restriction endonuclease McrA